jgi:Kef-type K+ transport system membrane component KefB
MDALTVFSQLAGILLLTVAVGAVGMALRQPLIISFIAVGIAAGPAGFGLISQLGSLELLASFGISILLFVVGLKLDLQIIRTMGPVALATGIGQVVFTSVIGYAIAALLGMAPLTALYVAIALTFSSTIIIVKLLSDKREIDALHGRIALGFLIVQDIVAILVLIALAALGGDASGGATSSMSLLLIAGRAIALLAVIALLMRYVFPRLLGFLARSHEMLLLFSIAWASALGALGHHLGLSMEVGAFLAGVSLASTEYREVIGARLVSVRDFLLIFFFLELGAGLDLSLLGAQFGSALLFSLFVLIGNPLIVMAIMGFMGYRKRTGFLAGLTVAQISEFSLILVARGESVGHLTPETVGLVTLVGLITIALSTYLILYSHHIYQLISPWLSLFERQVPHREQAADSDAIPEKVDVILFGLGRYGSNIARRLRDAKLSIFGVDFDPQAVANCRNRGFTAHYGDAEDPEFAATLPLGEARWIVSTAPERDVNLALIRAVRGHGYKGQIAVTSHESRDTEKLRQAGADLILMPYVDAADQAAELVAESLTGTRLRSPGVR